MDYSDDGDFENEDEKHLLDLVPSVQKTMNNHGKIDNFESVPYRCKCACLS
jgi:hypothetical protein